MRACVRARVCVGRFGSPTKFVCGGGGGGSVPQNRFVGPTKTILNSDPENIQMWGSTIMTSGMKVMVSMRLGKTVKGSVHLGMSRGHV